MRLVLDIGNSYTKMALYEGRKAVDRTLVHKSAERSEMAVEWLKNVESVAISTVGRASAIAEETKKSGKELFILSREMPLPFRNAYLTPDTLGLDRIAGMLGAYATHERCEDFLVIDMGTCNTYDMIVGGTFVGGNIAPGLEMRLRAMHEFTAVLPFYAPNDNGLTIGRCTREAMECGALTGMADEVNGYLRRFRSHAPDGVCILTGGYSDMLTNRVEGLFEINPYLVPDGLNFAAEMMSNKK